MPHYPTPSQQHRAPQQFTPPAPPELLTQQQYQQKKEFEQQQQQRRTIDPSQIPRPPLFTRPQDEDAIPIYHPKASLYSDTRPPPPADSRFLTQDDGNAAPQLIRSTLSAVPADRAVLRKTGTLPIALLCTPMANVSSDVPPRPRLLPNGDSEHWTDPMRIPLSPEVTIPPRCRACQAYVSSFWDDHCNFCGSRYINASSGGGDTSSTTLGYLCDKGTMEYVVDGPYITRATPIASHTLYAIDATCPHLKEYLESIECVGTSLAASRNKARIGIALVSAFGIHVPKLNVDTLTCDGFVIMSDVTEEPYSPLPLEDWTFVVETQSEQWKLFMSSLWDAWQPFVKQLDCQTSYGTMGHASSCGGAALAFLADALSETGGRGTWISWRRPNFGVGNIRDRERNNLALYKSPKTEQELYLPLQLRKGKLSDEMDDSAAVFYRDIGKKCAKNRVVLDIVLHTLPKPMAFLDLATLGQLCRIACGKLKWIKTSGSWREQFQQELLRSILSFHGTDAIFKVRCSNGLQVKRFLATEPGLTIESLTGSPEIELAVIGQDTCIAVELEHRVGGLPKKDKYCYVQSALLYTTTFGERRVRVSTLALKIATLAVDVYRGIDFGSLAAFWTRQAIEFALNPAEENPLDSARKDLAEKMINTLAGYRLNTKAWNEPRGQLMLPTQLTLLPLFTMALLKSSMLRSSLPLAASGLRTDHANPSADDRAYVLFHGSCVHPAMAMLMVHPNIFSLSTLDDADDAGEWLVPKMEGTPDSEVLYAAHHAYVVMPKNVHPSIACIQDNQIYLVDDGMHIFVFVGQNVDRDVKSELLEATPRGCKISTSSDLGQRVARLIWQMRTFSSVGPGSESTLRPTYAPVIVVESHASHKDPVEEKIMNLMVDDQLGREKDYLNFLIDSHKKVQGRVDKGSMD